MRQMYKKCRRLLQRAFTLLELLVVIAIIMILAAILMPALGRARDMARSSSCLSNLHSIGTALHMYTTSNDDLFPSCYTYLNGEKSSYLNAADPQPGEHGGYFHWTAAVDKDQYTFDTTLNPQGTSAQRYPRSAKQYVCPTHPARGWAPSFFTATRIANPPSGQITQTHGTYTWMTDDMQAPRISYVPNEAIMARKKFCDAHDRNTTNTERTGDLCFVSANEIKDPANTILLAEFSASAVCLYGSSSAGAQAYKTHRPTNAVKTSVYDHPKKAGTRVFDSEIWTTMDVDPATAGEQKPTLFKLTIDEALADINTSLTTPDKDGATLHHISYINPSAHQDGSNYLFVDGHAAKHTLEQTLNPDNWMWGDRMYSIYTKPVIKDNP